MKKTNIYDLNSYSTNERNGTYGGKAGDKEGITINDEYWIVKYPKNTKGMRGELDSYTTTPLSEYIGSNIYQILGIDVHETILGIRNDKLVVACKDFCKNEGSLREIRTLKNVYNKELSEKLEASVSSTSSSHMVDINDIMLHLNFNPILKGIPEIKDRFWEQFIIDILINNNDRNNGNWGVLYEQGDYKLAPVFDNGASFSNKLPDKKLSSYLQDNQKMQRSIDTSKTVYSKDGQQIYAKDLVQLEYADLYRTAEKLIPKIADKMSEIEDFILKIPERYNNITICSETRKMFYIKTMQMRLEQYLLPTLENAKNYFQSINQHSTVCISRQQINQNAQKISSKEKSTTEKRKHYNNEIN